MLLYGGTVFGRTLRHEKGLLRWAEAIEIHFTLKILFSIPYSFFSRFCELDRQWQYCLNLPLRYDYKSYVFGCKDLRWTTADNLVFCKQLSTAVLVYITREPVVL